MLIQASKFLSLLLRHNPSEIGLELSPEGWARVADLVRLTQGKRVAFTPALVEEIVRTNEKKRFILSDDGELIRANQGHSIQVDLGLRPQRPPDVLYHGTATRFLENIMSQGLLRMSRQHVHLSGDTETAIKVGRRHGSPVILCIDARAMHQAGADFFLSENGVWLTRDVPPQFLRRA